MDLLKASSWPHETELCTLDDVPLHRDCFLIGFDQFEDLHREWKRFFASGEGAEHPNSVLNVRWCALNGHGPDSCEVNVCVDMINRYHGALKVLPRSKFVVGVYFWNCEKRRYLVVDQDWFDQIEREAFSLYALVDVIGMKSLLDRHGRVEEKQLAAIRDGIDALACRNRDHAFLTFADNVLVKTLWLARPAEYTVTYKPEDFIRITGEIGEVFANVLGLRSYVVATQGANYSNEKSLLRVSSEQNHVFFGSLATPFVEMFDIDTSIRAALRAGVHGPKELYLSESLFLTLHYNNYTDKEELRNQLVPFKTKVNFDKEGRYLAIDRRDLGERLREAPVLAESGRRDEKRGDAAQPAVAADGVAAGKSGRIETPTRRRPHR